MRKDSEEEREEKDKEPNGPGIQRRQEQVDAFDRVIAVPAGNVGLLEIGVGRRADREQARNFAVLAWTARFRFVTPGALALRFGVSEQRMRARVRRLVEAGLLEALRPSVSYPQALHLTRAAV